MELVEFLLRRIAEDAAQANAATDGPWRYNPEKAHRGDYEESVFAGPAGRDAVCVASTGPMDTPQSMLDAAHITRWDPARVLAECAAKRAMIPHIDVSDTGHVLDHCDRCSVLRHLAVPYADHPDYNSAWHPEAAL